MGRVLRQRGRQAGLREQHRHPGVFQNEGDTVFWIRGIKRHVGGSRFQDRQQPDHHVYTALDADRNKCFWPDAEFAQPMGQSIGARIKVRIGQSLPGGGHSNGSRRGCHLRFDQIMNASLAREFHFRPVPIHQQLLPLPHG